MIDAIRAYVAADWRSHSHPAPRGGLVVGADKDPRAKVTYLFFGDRGDPIVAAKVARSVAAERALADEYTALRRVWASGARTVMDTVPRPLGLGRVAGRSVLVISALPGEPMTTRYYRPGHIRARARVEADFRAAGAWLARFQDETRGEAATFDGRWFDRWVRRAFERYRTEVGWSEAEECLVEELERRAAGLEGVRIPTVGAHGDFWMGNLLVDGGRVTGVIDWEHGRFDWHPFSDVYKFPTSYGSYLDRAGGGRTGRVAGHRAHAEHRSGGHEWRNLAGLRYAWFGRGWFPDLVRWYVGGQLRRLAVPSAVNAVFFPVFLAEQAVAQTDPEFRDGFRSALLDLARRDRTEWLWTSEMAA